MFITNNNSGSEPSTINFNHVCNIVLNEDKNRIEFYFDTMTARENWDYKKDGDAKKAYENIQKLLQAKDS